MLKLKPLFFSDLCKVEGLRFSIRYHRRSLQVNWAELKKLPQNLVVSSKTLIFAAKN